MRRRMKAAASDQAAGTRGVKVPSALSDWLEARSPAADGMQDSPFALAFHTNSLPMVIARMFDARFVEVNDAYCEFSGYSREIIVSGEFSGL